jgi:predicted GNAT superfamily acetyltransferase
LSQYLIPLASTVTSAMSNAAGAATFTIRPLTTQPELRSCLALQHATWGQSFTEAVPPSILKISQRMGGIAAGAFDRDGELLGFVFGLTGPENGRLVHWSDMLAVRSDAHGRGIGTALKQWQRDQAAAVGADVIYWTYDPLVARNGYINLMKLEALLSEYVEDMYGESDSDLHRGLGTDRFVVAWPLREIPESLDHRRRRRQTAVNMADSAPVINDIPGADRTQAGRHPSGTSDETAPALAVAVPRDILSIQNSSLDLAAEWRRSTRPAFIDAMARGYEVVAIVTPPSEELARYILLPRDPAG